MPTNTDSTKGNTEQDKGGFENMSEAKHSEVSSKGGKAAAQENAGEKQSGGKPPAGR